MTEYPIMKNNFLINNITSMAFTNEGIFYCCCNNSSSSTVIRINGKTPIIEYDQYHNLVTSTTKFIPCVTVVFSNGMFKGNNNNNEVFTGICYCNNNIYVLGSKGIYQIDVNGSRENSLFFSDLQNIKAIQAYSDKFKKIDYLFVSVSNPTSSNNNNASIYKIDISNPITSNDNTTYNYYYIFDTDDASTFNIDSYGILYILNFYSKIISIYNVNKLVNSENNNVIKNLPLIKFPISTNTNIVHNIHTVVSNKTYIYYCDSNNISLYDNNGKFIKFIYGKDIRNFDNSYYLSGSIAFDESDNLYVGKNMHNPPSGSVDTTILTLITYTKS